MNTFTSSIVALGMLGTLSGGLEAKNVLPEESGEGKVMNLLYTVEQRVCATSGVLPDEDTLTDYVKIPKNFSLKQFGMNEKEVIDFAMKNNLRLNFHPKTLEAILSFPKGAHIALTENGIRMKLPKKSDICPPEKLSYY